MIHSESTTLKKLFLALSWPLASQLALATCSDADKESYPVMAEAMADSGGDLFWQSYKTVTKDDYVLSLFRITGDAQGKRIPGQGSKGPLLLQHGFLTDSITWFTNLTDEDELSVSS